MLVLLIMAAFVVWFLVLVSLHVKSTILELELAKGKNLIGQKLLGFVPIIIGWVVLALLFTLGLNLLRMLLA